MNDDQQENEKKELENYIQTILTNIKNGAGKNFTIFEDIDFELAVITKKDAKGGFKVLIADAEGKYSKETISKIKFKYREIVESGPPKLG